MKQDIKIIGPSIKPWKNYLDRLGREPSPETTMALHSVLETAAAHAAVNTHVLSGRLLASMYTREQETRSPRLNKWKGEISVGLGVPHARFEFGGLNSRRNGPREDWTVHPSHDPYDGLEVYYAGVEAVLDALGR